MILKSQQSQCAFLQKMKRRLNKRSCIAIIAILSQLGGMKEKKTKHWTYRGETKAVSFRLPVATVEKIDDMAQRLGISKAQVVIEAIDGKAEG